MTSPKYSENDCCICLGKIDIQYHPVTGQRVWDLGHNAQPIKEGQCCTSCNDTVVLAARINSI